jgi:hypothetical protein
MAIDLYELALRVKSEGFKQAEKDLDNLDRKGKKTASSIEGFFKKAFAGVSVGVFFKKIVDESVAAQGAAAQLAAVIKSTGGVAGVSANEIDKLSASLSKTSVFGDDAVKSAASLLLTFTNIRGEVFRNTLPAITDLATAMGSDLNSAAIQVGKALNDPLKGVSALQRVGVSFSAAQKDVIKNLVETNRLAEAQGVILKELQVQFGGSAKAARDTLGGALAGLQNAFGDALEVSQDSSSGIIGAINSIADNLPGWREKFDSFFGFLKEGFTGVKIGYMRDAADIQRVLAFFNEIDAAVLGRIPGKTGELARAQGEIAKRQRAEVQRLEDEIDATLRSLKKSNLGFLGELDYSDPKGSPKPLPGISDADAAKKASKALDERIELLGKSLVYDDLRAKSLKELASIETTLRSQINAGNLSLERRIDLETKLAAVQELRAKKGATPLATSPQVRLTPAGDGTDPFLGLQGPLKTIDKSKVKELPEIINESGKIAKVAMEQLKSDMDAAIAGLSQTLGDGIYNAFAMAFNGESLGSIFKEFGKTILAGIGQIFTMMGQAYLSYGLVMSGLVPSLTNPFTAGPAAIAIGAALVALGGALGAVAGRGGNGPGRGTAQAGAFREPTTEITRLKFTNRDGSIVNGLAPVTPMHFTIIGPNDPVAQRAIGTVVEKYSRRKG